MAPDVGCCCLSNGQWMACGWVMDAVAGQMGSGWLVDGSWMLLQVKWALINVCDMVCVLYVPQLRSTALSKRAGLQRGGGLLTGSCVGTGRIGVGSVIGAHHPQ